MRFAFGLTVALAAGSGTARAAAPVPAALHLAYADGQGRVDDTVDLNGRLAWAPATGRFALVRSSGSDGSCGVDLVIVDGRGREMSRRTLTLGGLDFARAPRCQLGDKDVRKRVAERVAAANQQLAAEGFVIPAIESGLVENEPAARTSVARFASGLGLALQNGSVHVLRGEASVADVSLPRATNPSVETTDDVLLSAVHVKPARRIVYTFARDGARGLVDSGIGVVDVP